MPRQVALGSSFASGPGIESVLDAGCGRSARNYAQLTAQRLGLHPRRRPWLRRTRRPRGGGGRPRRDGRRRPRPAPRARDVLVDYLTVLPGVGGGCAALPMADDDLAFCRDVARRLEAATPQATPQATAESGAELLAASALSRDHSVCAAEPWVTGWVFGDVLAGGVAPYHPNAAGMRAVADALVDHLRA